MAQHDYVIDNSTGANVRADINSALQAIVTNNSGSSAPSATFPFMLFADSAAGTMKIRNAADNAFIELFQLDGTFTLEDGSASTPALAFRDDLNTGIFSSAADTFDIATGGVARFQIDSSEITFNESGGDTNFRVEGDTNANLFFLDAGNNRVGLGTNSPDQFFTVIGDTSIQGRIQITASTPDLLFSVPGGGLDSRIHNDGSGNLLIGNGNNSDTPSERLRIDSSGNIIIKGQATSNNNRLEVRVEDTVNKFIGSTNSTTNKSFEFFSSNTTASRIVTLDSDGLKFGTDTAATNALDDYEEGTFTPVISGTGSNNSKTYVTQTGVYTKIGNIVLVRFRVSWSARTADSGSAVIGGFPFGMNDSCATGGAFGYNNLSFGGTSTSRPRDQILETRESAAEFLILTSEDSGAFANVAASIVWNATGEVRGQAFYITTQ